MGEKREVYVEKLKAKIDEWNTEIGKLEVKANQVKVDARAKYQKQVGELKKKQGEVEVKVRELKKAGDGAWQDMKVGVDVAWKALGESVKAAKSRFK
jgi:hypothetical protein